MSNERRHLGDYESYEVSTDGTTVDVGIMLPVDLAEACATEVNERLFSHVELLKKAVTLFKMNQTADYYYVRDKQNNTLDGFTPGEIRVGVTKAFQADSMGDEQYLLASAKPTLPISLAEDLRSEAEQAEVSKSEVLATGLTIYNRVQPRMSDDEVYINDIYDKKTRILFV